jgi:hypothetical protein
VSVVHEAWPILPRAMWRKSTRSGGNGDCVEIADLDRGIAIRDSKNPAGPKLIFRSRDWRTFADAVKSGAYDL